MADATQSRRHTIPAQHQRQPRRPYMRKSMLRAFVFVFFNNASTQPNITAYHSQERTRRAQRHKGVCVRAYGHPTLRFVARTALRLLSAARHAHAQHIRLAPQIRSCPHKQPMTCPSSLVDTPR